MIRRPVSRWWWWMWKWVSPSVLAIILLWGLIQQLIETPEYSTIIGPKPYPGWAMLIGWGLILSSVLIIPIVAIYHRDTITFSPSAFCRDLSWAAIKRELVSPAKEPIPPVDTATGAAPGEAEA